MGYSNIKIYGNCDLNYVWCKSGTLTNEEIDSIILAGIQSPVWDSTTTLLATFQDNLNGADYGVEQKIIKYIIQKRSIRDNIIKDITVTDSYCKEVQDYNVGNNKEYIYTIIPVFDEEGEEKMGQPIEIDSIRTNFDDWYVIGINPTDVENQYVVDEDNIWRLQFNIKSSGMTSNYNKAFLEGAFKYPKAYSGARNYLSSSVDFLIGSMKNCSQYVDDDVERLDKWREFCNNGQLKLLKDRKGHVIPCDIRTTSTQSSDNTLEQETTVTFEFVQLADANDISVYGLAVD